MTDDTFLPFSFPAVSRKKVTAAFDGGCITFDGGVMLLAAAERLLRLADRLAAVIRDPRDPRRGVTGHDRHSARTHLRNRLRLRSSCHNVTNAGYSFPDQIRNTGLLRLLISFGPLGPDCFGFFCLDFT